MASSSLKENTRHGTVIFPLALYEWSRAEEWKVTPHWHDEMEFVYFQKGTFDVWLNTKFFRVVAPAIMCIHPGELHSLSLPSLGVESAIVFNLNILSFEHYDSTQAKLIRPLLDGRLRLPGLIDVSDELFVDFQRCYEHMAQKVKEMNAADKADERTKNAAYLQIKSDLFSLLAMLYQQERMEYIGEKQSKDEEQIENLKKMLTYINRNYASEIVLEDLAAVVNMNAQYLCRYFKKNIGKTIMEYVNEVRIEKAVQALTETNDKIIAIAQNTGFENTSYFVRRFKREKGMTPSEYRSMVRSQNSTIYGQ